MGTEYAWVWEITIQALSDVIWNSHLNNDDTQASYFPREKAETRNEWRFDPSFIFGLSLSESVVEGSS